MFIFAKKFSGFYKITEFFFVKTGIIMDERCFLRRILMRIRIGTHSFRMLIGRVLAGTLLFVSIAGSLAEDDLNAITLVDQEDRMIEIVDSTVPAVPRNISRVTGEKSDAEYQPVLVECNNENGGIEFFAPKGITKASVIYEYQKSTDGSTGICALFHDELPVAGPVGNASVGGLLIQDDWKCGYVYQAIPTNTDGTVSDLGYSIQNWIDIHGLALKHVLFPGDASRTKEWKRYFKMDQELITDENQTVKTEGIQKLLLKSDNVPSEPTFAFKSDKEVEAFEADVPVREIDIMTPSRTFSSFFIYDDETKEYYRWVGGINQYGDVEADEQLHVANLIIQRVEYTTSNKLMAPITIGRGNADIFTLGGYIDGYWVRDSEDDHTKYYDNEGHLLTLAPGSTYIALLSKATYVVIKNYELEPEYQEVYE